MVYYVNGGCMKSLGIVRSLDKEGRYSIPKELTKILDIETGDKLRIKLVDGDITIVKVEETCSFCKSTENLVEIHHKKICRLCLNEF